MCDQPKLIYNPNDVVWVKLSNIWWPAQVKDQESLDEYVTQGLKKKPLAVVKFFNEDFYEFIKNFDQIYHYNCLRKNEFIQKGLDLCRPNNNRNIPTSMGKFPDDVKQAELITGGNPDICNDPIFKTETEVSAGINLTGSAGELNLKKPINKKSSLKRSNNDTTDATPKKQIRFSLPSYISEKVDVQPSLSVLPMSASKITSQRHIKTTKSRMSVISSPKVNKVSSIGAPVKPISPEVVEKIKSKHYQSFIRIQPGVKGRSETSELYTCFRCSDTTRRVASLIDHYKSHEEFGLHLPPMSPKITSNANVGVPGPSGTLGLSTPKSKSKSVKQRFNSSNKSNETPTKKKSKKDDSTPRSSRSGTSSNSKSKIVRTSNTKRKIKKISHVNADSIDENKVLRDKLLKDWDDESDDDVNCGSVFKTTAEIHTSNNQANDSPEEDTTTASTSETVKEDLTSPLRNENNMIPLTLKKDDENEESSQSVKEDVHINMSAWSSDEDKKSSCFDFVDNDDAINLDKSHKFGQKLPRLLSDDKLKKPTNAEKSAIEADEYKDDHELIENQVNELLEVTKVSRLPDIPKNNTISIVTEDGAIDNQEKVTQLTENKEYNKKLSEEVPEKPVVVVLNEEKRLEDESVEVNKGSENALSQSKCESKSHFQDHEVNLGQENVKVSEIRTDKSDVITDTYKEQPLFLDKGSFNLGQQVDQSVVKRSTTKLITDKREPNLSQQYEQLPTKTNETFADDKSEDQYDKSDIQSDLCVTEPQVINLSPPIEKKDSKRKSESSVTEPYISLQKDMTIPQKIGDTSIADKVTENLIVREEILIGYQGKGIDSEEEVKLKDFEKQTIPAENLEPNEIYLVEVAKGCIGSEKSDSQIESDTQLEKCRIQTKDVWNEYDVKQQSTNEDANFKNLSESVDVDLEEITEASDDDSIHEQCDTKWNEEVKQCPSIEPKKCFLDLNSKDTHNYSEVLSFNQSSIQSNDQLEENSIITPRNTNLIKEIVVDADEENKYGGRYSEETLGEIETRQYQETSEMFKTKRLSEENTISGNYVSNPVEQDIESSTASNDTVMKKELYELTDLEGLHSEENSLVKEEVNVIDEVKDEFPDGKKKTFSYEKVEVSISGDNFVMDVVSDNKKVDIGIMQESEAEDVTHSSLLVSTKEEKVAVSDVLQLMKEVNVISNQDIKVSTSNVTIMDNEIHQLADLEIEQGLSRDVTEISKVETNMSMTSQNVDHSQSEIKSDSLNQKVGKSVSSINAICIKDKEEILNISQQVNEKSSSEKMSKVDITEVVNDTEFIRDSKMEGGKDPEIKGCLFGEIQFSSRGDDHNLKGICKSNISPNRKLEYLKVGVNSNLEKTEVKESLNQKTVSESDINTEMSVHVKPVLELGDPFKEILISEGSTGITEDPKDISVLTDVGVKYVIAQVETRTEESNEKDLSVLELTDRSSSVENQVSSIHSDIEKAKFGEIKDTSQSLRLLQMEDMHSEIDGTNNEQVTPSEITSTEVVKECGTFDATALQESKINNSSKYKVSDCNLEKRELPFAAPIIQKEKFSPPELATFDNILMNVSSGLQWTAMEYYADLEAQVRTDVAEPESLNNTPSVDSDGTSLIERSALQDEEKLNISVNVPINKTHVIDQGSKSDENIKSSTEVMKEKDLKIGISSDLNKSGVIFEFKVDNMEKLETGSPIKKEGTLTGKTKKRKWESKNTVDEIVVENETSNSKIIVMHVEKEKLVDSVFDNIKKDTPIEDNDGEVIQDQIEETASKKFKLDLNTETELLIKDEEAESTEVLKEITISQDSGPVLEEVIVNTSEIVECETLPTKSSLCPSADTHLKSENISVVGITENEIASEIKMDLNYTVLTDKNDLKKKDVTPFDPSQMELDINSMPVVIEEDLQDIKLSTPSVPPASTRSNMKQIRIQLRKAGESKSSLLQGNQNGKIIRIPGTSKEPVQSSNQVPGTSRLQVTPNLLTQHAFSDSVGGQRMLLHMSAIENPGGTPKYTLSKGQLRAPGISGQPLKIVIQQPHQQNAKLIMQAQPKPIVKKLVGRVISKAQASLSALSDSKTITTSNQASQKLILNQSRKFISAKNINKGILGTKTASITTYKNTKSAIADAVPSQTIKNVLPVAQGASNIQVISQSPITKAIMQRRAKTVTGAITSVKQISPQSNTVLIHTSTGVVQASKDVTKHILSNIPQTPPRSTPSASVLSNLKKNPVNKSRHSNINILQRSQKRNTRQQTTSAVIQPQTQQQNKQLLIPGGSVSSHELILNNMPVQFQNLTTTQPADVKMVYILDESVGQFQVDNSQLIAIDNSGENRGVFIESNPATEVDNLFLTFGDTSVINVTTSTSTPSQDILAKALANTQVLQSDTTDIPDTLYVEPQYPAPTLAHNVLETSFSLNPPIMTPLEVPSSVAPQITSITNNLIPVETVMKKNDAQPSMPLLTDDVEMCAGQTVYLESGTLVSGTAQPLTFQVINSDGNIVVTSTPTPSAQAIRSTNKIATNPVLFSTDLLKSEPRQVTVSRKKLECNIGNSVETIKISDINKSVNDRVPSISIENSQQGTSILAQRNRPIIQIPKVKKERRKSRLDTVRSEKRFTNVVELQSADRLSSATDDILQHSGLSEIKGECEEKTQQSRSGQATSSSKTFTGFTYTTNPVVSDETDSKFIIEERR